MRRSDPIRCHVQLVEKNYLISAADRQIEQRMHLPTPLPLKEPIKQGQCTTERKERQRERQGWRCLCQGMYRYITVSAPLRGSAVLRQYNDMCVVRRFRPGRTQGECSYRDWESDQITVTGITTSWAKTGHLSPDTQTNKDLFLENWILLLACFQIYNSNNNNNCHYVSMF